MTWRLRAGPGSFRGVAFRAEVVEFGGGRKTVTHEYPLRDDPFVEDLGRRGRSITVEAYVVGDDYIDQRDALLEALEREGPGRLVLPYNDVETLSFMVSNFRASESREEGGFARFLIEFQQTTVDAEFPLDVADLTARIEADAASTLETLQSALLTDFDVADAPAFALSSLSSIVTAAGESIRTALAPITGAVSTVTGAVDDATQFAADIKRQVDGIILDADALVRDPLLVADRFRDLFEALFESPALPERNLDALLDAYEFSPSIPKPGAGTSTREREGLNYDALTSFIRGSMVVSAARFAPVSTFDTYDSAISTRDRIADLLDDQAEVASDPVYQALADLRASLVKAVPGEQSDLPRLLEFTPATTLPSLVIAHRLYGNVDKELDLVARNGIRHPAFVTGGRALEVLSDA
jgi:prophage DNA circulation protein